MFVETLEEPYTLLNVPRPFGSSDARSYGCAVTESLSAKSRPEAAVAVDGEGIYIYETTNPRLVASYAVPPQTRFLCKPTSIVHRKADRSIQRFTYAVYESKDTQARNLVCFSEERRVRNTIEAGQPGYTKAEHKLKKSTAPVVAVVAFAVDGRNASLPSGQPLNVLVVEAYGLIERFAGDLSRSLHTLEWQSKSVDAVVTHASLVNLPLLSKALRHRTGSTKNPESGSSATGTALVLARRTKHKKDALKWSLYFADLSPSNSGAEQSRFSLRIQALAKLGSSPQHMDSEAISNAIFALSANCTHVFANFAGKVIMWDITNPGTRPTELYNTSVTSLLPLEGDELLVSRNDSIAVIDTHWRTSRTDFQILNVPAKLKGTKRSRAEAVASLDNVSFLYVDRKANLIVGLSREALVCVPFTRQTHSSKRRKLDSSSLADSLGRALPDSPSQDASASMKSSSIDRDFAAQIEGLVAAQQVDDLEELLAKDLDLSYEKLDTVITDDPASKTSIKWAFPEDIGTLIRKTDMTKAQHVLRSLIHVDSQGAQVKLYAPNAFRWLGAVGLLSAGLGDHLVSYNTSDTFASLVAAFVQLDPTLAVLEHILSIPMQISCRGIVKSLQVVIDSLDNVASVPETLALPAPQTNGSDSIAHDGDDTHSLADASRAAEEDLAYAIASLDNGTRIRGGLLRSIFERLTSFPAGHLRTTLGQELTPRQIVFLINILRVELADGGWTTRYVDDTYWDEDEAHMENAPTDQSIRIISHLLNAAVDAIGSTGWNVSLTSDKQLNTDEMILVLRAEINAVLEGTQEYTVIGDILQEFVKYCAQAQPQLAKKKRQPHPIYNPGFVQDDSQDALLPMGCRIDRIANTRVSKGGRVDTKSKGAIGQEISMRVGKYSIDRIRV